MTRTLRTYARPVTVIVVFAALSIALGVYILGQQRLQSPFSSRYEVRVELSDTPGLTPGLGQSADVAGVPVGQITNAVLQDGRALVTLSIDRSKLPHVYGNATAALVPTTALDDLEVDITPGGPPAKVLKNDAILPVGQSVTPEGVDDLLDSLDGDTRDYLSALISATGYGMAGHGPDLRALLKQIGPTAGQVKQLSAALDSRRTVLAKVVHALSVLAVAAGNRDNQIRQVVSDGSATLKALAGQDSALASSLSLLPQTLEDTRNALSSAGALSTQLTPTLKSLTPAVKSLPAALSAVTKLDTTATPELKDVVRPLVERADTALVPLLAAAPHLNAVTPDLANAFKVLQYVFDELLYSDGGTSRSYAFYGAWAQHDGNSVLSTGDAQGEVINSALIVSCSELNTIPQLTQIVDGVASLLPTICPSTGTAG